MLIVRAFYKNLPTKYGNYNKSAGRSSQILRVYRGGSWYDLAKFGRLSYRSSFNSPSNDLLLSRSSASVFSRFQLFQQIVSEEQEAIGHIDIAHATVKIQA